MSESGFVGLSIFAGLWEPHPCPPQKGGSQDAPRGFVGNTDFTGLWDRGNQERWVYKSSETSPKVQFPYNYINKTSRAQLFGNNYINETLDTQLFDYIDFNEEEKVGSL